MIHGAALAAETATPQRTNPFETVEKWAGNLAYNCVSNGGRNYLPDGDKETLADAARAADAKAPAPTVEDRTWYGAKYERGLSTTEIARRFRADVKAAVAAGTLPRGLKLSVRTDYFSGGSSIDVTIVQAPGLRILNPERLELDATNQPCYGTPWATAEARALDEALTAMLNAYNFDGSDIQSDYFHVNFYGHVNFSSALTDAERSAFLAARAAPTVQP